MPVIKQLRVCAIGKPARILKFTSRGTTDGGEKLFFVHRYNPPEFDELIGKSEDVALEWLAQNGWRYHYIKGGRG